MQSGKKKLAIIVLGKRNSGKSNTWYAIFGKTIRSGWKSLILNGKELKPYLKNSSHEEDGTEISQKIFVRNASFEEAGDEVENYFNASLPEIIFCSVQYIDKGKRTISWFKDNGYFLYIQWLNPGYHYTEEYDDYLNFQAKFSKYGLFTKHTGKEKLIRVNEIKQFVFDWQSS